MSSSNHAEFLRGFEEVTRLQWPDSEAHWIAFTRKLSDMERRAIEAGRYEVGLLAGEKYKALVQKNFSGLTMNYQAPNQSGRSDSSNRL